MTRVLIHGGRELAAALRAIGRGLSPAMVEQDLQPGAQLLREEFFRRVRKRSRKTANSMTFATTRKRAGDVELVVGPRGGKGGRSNVGWWLERGTSNTQARPWARPSWLAKAPEILADYLGRTRARVNALVAIHRSPVQ